MKTGLRSIARRAIIGVAERALDAAGYELDPAGVLVLRVSATGEPRETVRHLSRVVVALEGAGVRSASFLTLSQFEPTPWPAATPRALICVDEPGPSWLEPLAELADEFGWAPICLMTHGAWPVEPAAWVGAGCVPGVLGASTDAGSWGEARTALAEAVGFAPHHAGLLERADARSASRAARAAGFAAVFGVDRGLACARFDLHAQPTLELRSTTPALAVAWSGRQPAVIAAAEARRVVLTLP